ncbi:MAG: hypothetical protein WAW96_19215 [Alphaproteobacteria bacterium]
MKRSKMIPFLLVLVSILGFYGVAFSGGGYEGSGCPATLPEPTSGPILYGTFTVARDRITFGIEGYDHYNVHIVLRHKLNQVHLYSFLAPLGTKGLCDYEEPEIKEIFAKQPCILIDPSDFDLPITSVPVIYDLQISKRDFCTSTVGDEMIFGLIAIRVVPPVPPKPPKPRWR